MCKASGSSMRYLRNSKLAGWSGAIGLPLLLVACGGDTKSTGVESPSQGGRGAIAAGDGGGAHLDAGKGGAMPSGGTANGTAGEGYGEAGAPNGGDGMPPDTSAFVRVNGNAATRLDILFVIDNSSGMRDKQTILELSLAPFLERLLEPECVDANGEPLGQSSSAGVCAGGSPEFQAVRDLHLGVVTSSLGDMGSGDACPSSTPLKDDKALLIGSLRELTSANSAGFLNWDPDAPQELSGHLADHVAAAGSTGCGYEMSLEAWYRFLIDPEPPELVQVSSASSSSVAGPPSQTLLAQRAAFLRPDSVVAIVMLTDENDCSIIDYGQGWITGFQGQGTFRMPRGTSVCAEDPNDVCCFSCSLPEADVPDGCTPPAADTECEKGEMQTAEDHPNLRCATQKRRFGVDLLQPLSRYVEGLSERRVAPRPNGKNDPLARLPNPLFASPTGFPRTRSNVFLAGIVGVPWQDLSDEASWSDESRLRYLTHAELTTQGRWDWILSSEGGFPGDALMYETWLDRTTVSGLSQIHPSNGRYGVRLVPSSATDPDANPINGHESSITDGSQLQPACVMDLPVARDCDGTDGSCECEAEDVQYNRAICDGTRQIRAAAYPSTRQLTVLRDYGDLYGNSVVGSICAKGAVSSERSSDAAFGYRAVLDALIDRMKGSLQAECSVSLKPESDGRVPLRLVEIVPDTGSGCVPCSTPRIDPSFDVTGVVARLAESPNPLCLCEIPQLEASALDACQTDLAMPGDGFCYVSGRLLPEELEDSPALRARRAVLADCPPDAQQKVRVPEGVPMSGALLLLVPETFR
jgi:hypothetical protein